MVFSDPCVNSGFYFCTTLLHILNYLLHVTLKRLSGADVRRARSGAREDEDREKTHKDVADNWEFWTRNWMGLGDSPYRCIQWMVRLKMVVVQQPMPKEVA